MGKKREKTETKRAPRKKKAAEPSETRDLHTALLQAIQGVSSVFQDEDWREWARAFLSDQNRSAFAAMQAASAASGTPATAPKWEMTAARAAFTAALAAAFTAAYPDRANRVLEWAVDVIETDLAEIGKGRK